MQKTTIALIGATGKAGSYILQQLLSAGYKVKALIRDATEFETQHPLLGVVQGDVSSIETIRELLHDTHAVVSALGQRAGEPLVCAEACRNLIQAMNEKGMRRLIFLAGITIDVPGDQKSVGNQAKTNWMREHYPAAAADKQLAYEMIAKSDLMYTLIRVPMIRSTTERPDLDVSLLDCTGDNVSTTSLAAFVTEQLDNDSLIRKAPFVADK